MLVLGIYPCRYQRFSELPTERRIAYSKEKVFEEDESFKKVPLARAPAILMEPRHEHMLSVKASNGALEWVAQGGLPLELL